MTRRLQKFHKIIMLQTPGYPVPPNPHQPTPPGRPVFGYTPPPTPSAPVQAGHSEGNAIEVTDTNFSQVVELADPNLPVLVECWAEWCATCKMLLPTIENMAAELKGKAKVCTLNVDSNPMMATKLQLRSMPTILVYKSGQLTSQMFGMQTKGKLMAVLGF